MEVVIEAEDFLDFDRSSCTLIIYSLVRSRQRRRQKRRKNIKRSQAVKRERDKTNPITDHEKGGIIDEII